MSSKTNTGRKAKSLLSLLLACLLTCSLVTLAGYTSATAQDDVPQDDAQTEQARQKDVHVEQPADQTPEVQSSENEMSLLANYGEGQVDIGGVRYWCTANGEASLRYAKNVSGTFTVPATIVGINGETYWVTEIGRYTSSGREVGAFAGNNNLTGLQFEEGSRLRKIANSAFNACYGLGGARIVIPDTVTDIGASAFDLNEGMAQGGIAYLKHPHVVKSGGTLPDLNTGNQIAPPSDLTAYESVIDSSFGNVTLYKSARWLDNELTEAEIRIDFGKEPNYTAKVDFVFVIDQSPSMHAAAEYTDENNVVHEYPRTMLADDIVYDISKRLLESDMPGYDNRIALTAFDSGILWSSPGFVSTSAEVGEILYSHPLTSLDKANYGAGLQGAINLINNRDDESRKVAVIFLSDGLPTAGNGTAQAQTLRNMRVPVYPVAIYSGVTQELKNISYNSTTAYSAENTEDFQSIITEVASDIISRPSPLSTTLTDVLGDDFNLASGTAADIDISPGGGTVQINGGNLDWDLNGCDPEMLHTIKIKVNIADLDQESRTKLSGLLPTNASLGSTDGTITTENQPELARYVVKHSFVSAEDPTADLPGEVLDLLPGNEGGYRDGVQVAPTAITQTRVTDSTGDIWEFTGWDKADDVIAGADAEFVGTWHRISLTLSFAKTNSEHAPLPGAEFTVYRWMGPQPPAGDDAFVSAASIAANKWVEESTPIVSAASAAPYTFTANGIYQLVESVPPNGYYAPEAQWRFTIESFALDSVQTIVKHPDALGVEDFVLDTSSGSDVWTLVNHRLCDLSFYKVSGVLFEYERADAQALPGAEFDLYLWAGTGDPPDTARVTQGSIQSGDWKFAGSAVSGADGEVSFSIPAEHGWYYQLVETRAPENHTLPTGQWRIAFTQNGGVDTNAIKLIPGDAGALPPKLEVSTTPPFDGKLTLTNVPLYEYPKAGGIGSGPFALAGMVCLLIAALYAAFLLARRRRQASQAPI